MASSDDIKEKLERLKQRRRAEAAGEAAPAPPAAVSVAPPPPAQPPAPVAPPAAVPGLGLMGLLDTMARLLKGGRKAPPPPAGDPPVYTVLAAQLAGDADGQGQAHVLGTLGSTPAFKTRAVSRSFQLDNIEDPGKAAALIANLRHVLAFEEADALVWGERLSDGSFRLRIASTHLSDDDRAGAFGIATRIELPPAFSEPFQHLLLASVLAAAEPATEAQKGAVKKLLPQAAAAVEPLAAKPPVALSMPQQRSLQMAMGHIAAATAQALPAEEAAPWHEKAVIAYRQAARRLGRTDPGWESGFLHKAVAAVLMARAERAPEPTPLFEEAVAEWRLAAETLTRAQMPQEWANVQVRLGVALYRLDLLTGQTDLLRESVQALQGALQVYSRTETPQRWAEIMHNLARVLEVYGDQIRNTAVLRRAAEACEAVLEIRSREKAPLAWAATQNTLGSALFLLDKHSEDSRHLDHAALALEAALEVFRQYGAKGPARVAERNLAHVRKLAELRKNRAIPDPHWADDPPDEPTS